MNNCEQCKSFYLELERLRRLVPTGTYTLNVQYEEEIQRLKDAGEVLVRSLERMTRERDEAQAIAKQYELDWYAAKSEFGTAMAKMREALRAAEQRELAALAELDEAKVAIRLVLEADCLKSHAFERGDDDASVYELCTSVVRKP